MAAPTQVFKGNAAVVRVKGKKIANCTSSDVNYNTNAVNVPMSDGLGRSKGFPIGEITLSTFETVSGLSSRDLIAIMVSQEIIDIEFTQGGVTVIVTGGGDTWSKKSATEKGMTDGSFKFSGTVKTF